ncbi:MAG: hypothetical protein EXR99_15320 [Gemmataceae bacterium]|nr:hypothetical protein [Gemmataceae bacterium]
MTNRQVFFDERGIHIDSAMARFPRHTFAIAGITSVVRNTLEKYPQASRLHLNSWLALYTLVECLLVLVVLGNLLFWSFDINPLGVLPGMMEGNPASLLHGLWSFLLTAVQGKFFWQRLKKHIQQRAKHLRFQVVVSAAGGEKEMIQDEDRLFIDQVANALEKAIREEKKGNEWNSPEGND